MAPQDPYIADPETVFLAGQCLYKIEILEGEYGDPHGLRYYADDELWPYGKGDSLFGQDLIEVLSHYTSCGEAAL